MSVLHVGTETTLAAYAIAGINNGDVAYIWLNDYSRKMVFDATSTKEENTTNHPYYLRPNDYSTSGVWIEEVGAEQPEAWNGSQIRTGSILSTNYSTTEGGKIDLDLGTITFGGSDSPTFSVTAAGVLTATGAIISGTLTAILGSIGGWEISADTIQKLTTSSGITLDSSVPKISLTDGTYDRVFIGKDSAEYTIRVVGASGELLFDISDGNAQPYVSNYADSKAIELELMKINFQNISWAQFAIYDAFDDETRRADPDPSTNDALISRSSLVQGDDVPDKVFGFVSKTYTDITTVESGTSTSVGLDFLTDSSKEWFTDEVRNLTLKDSAASTFNVVSNTSDTLTISGTPASGAYSLIDDDPAYVVAFCSLSDSSNGGYGTIKMEVSFDGGSNYQTFYETSVTDLRQGTTAIANTGNDYVARFTLTNDGSGEGPIVYKFLVCTDPSCWRF